MEMAVDNMPTKKNKLKDFKVKLLTSNLEQILVTSLNFHQLQKNKTKVYMIYNQYIPLKKYIHTFFGEK